MTRQGYQVISCDPVYQFSATAIAQRIAATCPVILGGVRANLEHYIWDTFSSPAELGDVRMAAMHQFLADFPTGLQAGRYHAAALPDLPFEDRTFDLALCSHFLFSYSDHFSLEFHRAAIAEMCRVAREVRIFPLLTISGEPSPYVDSIQTTLLKQGYQVRIKEVSYEFQKGGNQLLQVCSNG
jgi:hypothetical protein